MSLKITCPGCQKVLAVKETLAGKLLKCPKCGGKVSAPKAAAKPGDDVFAFAEEPEAVSPTTKNAGHKKLPGEKPSPPEAGNLRKGETTYYEVLDAKSGKVTRYEPEEIIGALVEGEITRKTKARTIEAFPVFTEDTTPQTLQEAIDRWNLNREWRPIGKGIAREDAGVRRLYLHVDYGPFAAFIGAGLFFLVAFLFYVVPRWSPPITEETVEHVREGLRDEAKQRIAPKRGTDMAMRYSLAIVGWFIDESHVLLMARAAALIGGLGLGIAFGSLGTVLGFLIGWLITYLEVLEPRRPPPDGFDPASDPLLDG